MSTKLKMLKTNFVIGREKLVKVFPFFVFCCSCLLSNSAISIEGQVEAIIQPLLAGSKNNSKNPIKFTYTGEKFEPPINLTVKSVSHPFTGTKEYRFLVNMLDTIKTKDASDFKQLWARNEKAPNIYLEAPDVWQQFQNFIVHSSNIYLVNKINYGEFTILQLIIEQKKDNEVVNLFKSYVAKKQNGKLVLTDDLAGDPGFKFVQLYSTYMGAEYVQSLDNK